MGESQGDQTMKKTCPKCGADGNGKPAPKESRYWCSSSAWENGDFYQSPECVKRERDNLLERVADRERERDHANLVADSALRENKSLMERVKRLEEAADNMIDAVYSVQDWSGTRIGDCAEELEKAKETNP
jgi:hypothetical protein